MIKTELDKKIVIFYTTFMFLPVSFLYAQGSVDATPDSSVVTPVEVATSTPRVIQPAPALSPQPMPAATIDETKPTPAVVSEPVVEPEDFGFPLIGFVVIALALVLAGLGVYKLQTKSKNQENDKKDKSRCFDIKQLMDKKLKEVTDLKSQLENKVKEIGKEKIRENLTGKREGELFALIETGEKEYNRLKQLFKECMAEFEVKKRVIIVHGWGGSPEEGWFPWLKKELEAKGFQVFIPAMPEPDEPKIETWIPFLSKVVGTADLNTFFVGHSIGCQAIIRYLETLPEGVKVGGAVFVAGWYNLRNLETEEEKRVAGPWVNTPRNDEKIREAVNKAVAIFSDNDPFVLPENQESWKEKVGAKIIVEHNKGHFNEEEPAVWELPSALEALLNIQ